MVTSEPSCTFASFASDTIRRQPLFAEWRMTTRASNPFSHLPEQSSRRVREWASSMSRASQLELVSAYDLSLPPPADDPS